MTTEQKIQLITDFVSGELDPLTDTFKVQKKGKRFVAEVETKVGYKECVFDVVKEPLFDTHIWGLKVFDDDGNAYEVQEGEYSAIWFVKILAGLI
jgi:hypothetical protein